MEYEFLSWVNREEFSFSWLMCFNICVHWFFKFVLWF